ncbi:hypothetical protein DV451_004036 [Geotrichum candidum]|uniref:Ribosomal protein L5 C-terminal domain-containing protein n=2 Tax=Geotrichum candidum TaxID=1173061 RepID=A0A9P5KRX5_GEOCN|nr:hypothetical protein DV451_004036 [Geotrichum candidum]KAI9210192.1 hypothetical protein DS838_004927 [Geotrichum bryndzae]KAF5109380.1 hypothetical protein DV453_001559 [Geotrichum candidum]KAF5118700.1 hypothetical protein DV454_000307 [Geotrichum candidum]KAF5132135.1 hypothetical protein DV495_001637 [Geotrichum candidum]
MSSLRAHQMLVRGFHTSSPTLKASVSIRKPVHHTVKFKNAQVSSRFRELLIPKNSILSSAFKPVATNPDRVADHHSNTVVSDLLLINYNHRGVDKVGQKFREWDGTSPYHLNRTVKPPRGTVVETPNVKRRTDKNVPKITGISLNTFVKEGRENTDAVIPAILQLQQITGVKPHSVYSKTNVPTWKLRKGVLIGAKAHLEGRAMSQFLSTLSEIVLPRSKTFTGISNAAGDRYGNISFGLTANDVRFFPEIEGNQELWPRTFGMDVTIHTTAQVDPDARVLLSAYGLIFEGKEKFPARW